MTPWDAYKLAADSRLAREEEWRLKAMRSPRGRLGCALSAVVLVLTLLLALRWLNRHPGLLKPEPDADGRWYHDQVR
jgi:hypothetical protein